MASTKNMKILNLFCIFLVLFSPFQSATAQNDCDGTRYRFTSAFESFEVTPDVVYGNAINSTGLNQNLLVDIYEPVGDFSENRPLIIMAHGGFFIGGENDNPDVLPLCQDLTRMGYVVASITYRLGIDNFFDIPNALVRSVWRGYHDGKAAVRYFRKTAAEDDNPWGIDPNRIMIGGVSAGAFLGLHLAYVDEISEIPEQIDQTAPGMAGGLEGESGNPGYSTEVLGVINVAGALKTADFISVGDEPLVSVHGTADGTVPFGSGMIYLSGFPITEVDGSSTLHATALENDVSSCFTILEGADHVAHVGDADAYFQTLGTIASVTSGWVCNDYEPLCGAYDYNAVGVQEWLQKLDGNVRIFPTLVKGVTPIQVQWLNDNTQSQPWSIFDATGKLISSGVWTMGQNEIPVVGLSSGMHILRFANSANSAKFWVQ
jgi:poly(3-hydroxybutyrate) depolymerase